MVDQTWGDELFEDGATAYGPNPNLYVKVQPWSTQPETTTGYSLRSGVGVLTSNYQELLGVATGAAGPVLGLLAGGAAPSAGDATWFLERQNERANSNVAVAPSLLALAGEPDFDSFKQFGVCSHVSGGTLVTNAGLGRVSDYYSGVSGLFLIEEKETATRHRVVLLRLTSGSISVIGDEEVRVTDSIHAQGSAADFFRPTALRLHVEEDGANRRVRAFRTDLSGVERQLFGSGYITVSSLADGRCGFGLQSLRTSSEGCESVGLASLFTIRDAANTELLFADTFERAQRKLGRDTTEGGRSGTSIMSAWAGDGETGSNNLSRCILRRDTSTADRVIAGEQNDLANSGVGNLGFHVHQIPPLSTEQRYQATFVRLNQDATIPTRMGLISRLTIRERGSTGIFDCSGTRPAGEINGRNKTGYSVSVRHDPASTPVWLLEVRHYAPETDLTYAGDLLATADLTSFSLAVGTAFSLDVETRNFDGDRFGEGSFVALVVKVNASQVTPVAENIPGVAEQDDFIVDTRSVATGTRGASGVFLTSESLSATGALVAVSQFQALTLTQPPVPRPDEQATVAVSPEAASASGSLTIPLSAVVDERVRPTYWRHTFESGKEQTIANQTISRRVWQVSAVMQRQEWEALSALLSSNGTHTPFAWTHPYTGEAFTVLFGEDQINFRENGEQDYGYSASFELVQVFAQQTFNPEL